MSTLHFTLGKDTGILLSQIAHEKLLDGEIEKAIDTFQDSFVGLSKELATKLVVGTHVIVVINGGTEVLVQEYDPDVHKGYRGVFSLMNLKKELKEILSYMKFMEKSGHKSFRAKGRDYRIMLTNELIDTLIERGKITLEDVSNEYAYLREELTIRRIFNEYLERLSVLKSIIKFVKRTLQDQGIDVDIEKLVNIQEDIRMYARLAMERGKRYKKENQALEDYLAASQILDKMYKIEPVSHKEKWSAGWISPEGKYYALNGEIANMLHNRIADLLVESRIIPDSKNPDSWLEAKGWVKQHGDWILYGAYDNPNADEGTEITPEQIHTLYEMAGYCYNGRLQLGFNREYVSAAMLKMIEPMLFKTKYFKL